MALLLKFNDYIVNFIDIINSLRISHIQQNSAVIRGTGLHAKYPDLQASSDCFEDGTWP